ncbi:MAG: protein-glutamate O-methyltransferase CheR [Acidobacteriota bacterium]
MTESSPWSVADRPTLAPAEHAYWRRLIRQRCGIDFGDSRISTLRRCLGERSRVLGLRSFDAYHAHLSADDSEWENLVELLVNGESSFFRHPPSFDALHKVLRELLARKTKEGDTGLRLWSAGCSRGQEAYSLAICAREATIAHPEQRVLVVGSDLSRTALAAATAGRYRERSVARLPEAVRRRHFKACRDLDPPQVQIHDTLRQTVRFHHWNLVRADTWPLPRQDVIFCQNLLIYFHKDDRAIALERFFAQLNPGGYFFPGPGEAIGWRREGLKTHRVDDTIIFQREH